MTSATRKASPLNWPWPRPQKHNLKQYPEQAATFLAVPSALPRPGRRYLETRYPRAWVTGNWFKQINDNVSHPGLHTGTPPHCTLDNGLTTWPPEHPRLLTRHHGSSLLCEGVIFIRSAERSQTFPQFCWLTAGHDGPGDWWCQQYCNTCKILIEK